MYTIIKIIRVEGSRAGATSIVRHKNLFFFLCVMCVSRARQKNVCTHQKVWQKSFPTPHIYFLLNVWEICPNCNFYWSLKRLILSAYKHKVTPNHFPFSWLKDVQFVACWQRLANPIVQFNIIICMLSEHPFQICYVFNLFNYVPSPNLISAAWLKKLSIAAISLPRYFSFLGVPIVLKKSFS